MVGFHVAAALVTLAQYLRIRERRLLPIALLFALGAVGQSQADLTRARRWHAAAGACALVLAVMLSPRAHPHP